MGTVTRMPIVARAEQIPRTAPAIVKESAEMCPITAHVGSTTARAGYRFFCLVGFFHGLPQPEIDFQMMRSLRKRCKYRAMRSSLIHCAASVVGVGVGVIKLSNVDAFLGDPFQSDMSGKWLPSARCSLQSRRRAVRPH